MAKYLNIVSDKQKFLEFSAIFLTFVAVGFRFGSENVGWFWHSYPFAAMIFVMIALLLSLLWIRIEKHKTQIIINEIRNSNKSNTNSIHEKINSLTRRQREIFDLILEEKSNKEIMDMLFIELSTLKTHINHIYKTLGVANRKEAKTIGKLYGADQT